MFFKMLGLQVYPSENEWPVFVFFHFAKIALLPESLLVLTGNLINKLMSFIIPLKERTKIIQLLPSWVKVDLVHILPVTLRKRTFWGVVIISTQLATILLVFCRR